MIAWRSRMLVAAGWLSLFAAAGEGAPPSSAELRAWLVALDADDYAAREAASRQLIAAGEAAIDALAEGVGSRSPEAAWRASSALEQIALAGSEATLTRVGAALERLSLQGHPGLSRLAQDLKARQAQLRHDRAVARISALGGRFGGADFSVAVGGFFGGAMPAVVEVIDDVVAEKVAGDIKELIEAGDPAGARRELEIPAELKAFDDALKLVAAGMRKPAEFNEKDPPPPPDAAPPEAPAPEPPPPLAEPPALAAEVAVGEVFIADAVGIDIGAGDDESADKTLALDDAWRGGDAGLAALGDLPRIVALEITGTKLTDAALAHIAALPRLNSLELHGTKFTAAGLRRLRQQRPGTKIFARGEAMLGVNAEMEGPCVLSSVYYGSGAYEAGLAQGDEIVAVDGHKVADFSDLTIAVFARRPGDKLKIDFKRGGELKSLAVLLKDRKLVEPGSR